MVLFSKVTHHSSLLILDHISIQLLVYVCNDALCSSDILTDCIHHRMADRYTLLRSAFRECLLGLSDDTV